MASNKLDANYKAERSAMLEELLLILEECQQNGFISLLTRHELWFSLQRIQNPKTRFLPQVSENCFALQVAGS
jgi:hypothetical protein